jgi:radical SAM superfamily enzyme YgiQ (UPF0313 family)
MNVLLLSMPDAFEHMPPIAIRMPNGALPSLAANVDPHHHVGTADLILMHGHIREVVRDLVSQVQPDVIGLSVMTFQRPTAFKIAQFVRSLRPKAAIVAGGYDPSLAPEAYTTPDSPFDFVVRGEGEATFRLLLRGLEGHEELTGVSGLTWRQQDTFIANPARHVSHSPGEDLKLPDRGSRLLSGYTMLGRQIDVVETSRGCTFDCSFCSIIEMRGRNFHPFPIERVIADLMDARTRGARMVFLVDDNIMLDVQRFAALCEAIIDAGLNDVRYVVQAMTSSIANHGAELAPLMRRANFEYVFLGIENVVDDDLGFLKARAKNKARKTGGNASIEAATLIRRHGMFVVGGLIVGNPGDTPETIETNLAFAKRYVDWPYIQHPMPYPGTPLSRDLQARGLIAHTRVEEYDGTTAVVTNPGMDPEEMEFRRWRVERWIKFRHMPKALRANPRWVIRNAPEMFNHTFRGCSWKTFLGLESSRVAHQRYREIRAKERTYL